MPNEPLYPNSKLVDGDLLILCEGDALGYEPQLLKVWADATDLGGRFVKVLPCGTSTALYGMADAVGRTVPIVVIEDRDFRTVEEARKDCEKNFKNRESRSVAMRSWFAWGRAEIENYFVDDAILPEVFATTFECTKDAVRDAVRSALATLSVAQALEYALYRTRKSWLTTDANRALRVNALEWKPAGLTSLAAKDVRAKLEGRLTKWQKSLHDGTTWEDPMAGDQLLKDFDSMVAQWSTVTYESDVWRRDWACKEILKHVRMMLAGAKAGWWSHPTASNAAVNWDALGSDKARDEYDRKLERDVQPGLVKAVTSRLLTDSTFDLHGELAELAKVIRVS